VTDLRTREDIFPCQKHPGAYIVVISLQVTYPLTDAVFACAKDVTRLPAIKMHDVLENLGGIHGDAV
jgi:hypothetical protein